MDKERKRFKGKAAEIILDNFFLKRKRETQEEFFRYCTFVTSPDDGRRLGKDVRLKSNSAKSLPFAYLLPFRERKFYRTDRLRRQTRGRLPNEPEHTVHRTR